MIAVTSFETYGLSPGTVRSDQKRPGRLERDDLVSVRLAVGRVDEPVVRIVRIDRTTMPSRSPTAIARVAFTRQPGGS